MKRLEGDVFLWILMDSDWHCGAGHGSAARGDKAHRLDSDWLPMCGGRQFKYALRGAGRQVAFGLDDGGVGEWTRLWARLLGTNIAGDEETGALLAIPNVLMPECVAKELRDRPAVAAEALVPRIRNRHSRATRQSQDKMLLRQEMARAGTVLCVKLSLPEMDAASSSLLVAATLLVNRLGGGKNRGSGRIRVVVSDVAGEILQPSEFVTQLKTLEPPGTSTDGDDSPGSAPSDPQSLAGDTVSPPGLDEVKPSADDVIAFEVSTRSDVIVQETVQGNVIHSLDFLPGRLFLPAISRALGRERTDKLIRDGKLVVRNAYPAVEVGDTVVRALPIPRAFMSAVSFVGTGELSTFHNGLARTDDAPEEKRKPVEDGYLGLGVSFDEVSVAHVRHVRRTHSVIDPETEATNERVGGVYTAASIAAGQRFLFDVRLTGLSAMEKTEVAQAIEGLGRVGRSKTVEYGEVAIARIGDSPCVNATPGLLSVEPDETTSRDVWVLLASDTIVLGDDLLPECTSEALRRAMSDALRDSGVVVTSVDVAQMTARNGAVRRAETLGVRRTESFHARWGLARDTIVALRAGSCARLRVTTRDKVDAQTWRNALAEVERRGLGERVAEGYGEVRFRLPFLAEPKLEGVSRYKAAATPRVLAEPPPQVREAAAAYVRNLQRLAAERRVRALASEWAAKAENRRSLGVAANGPSLSQLGAIRALVTATELSVVDRELLAFADKEAEEPRGLRKALGTGLRTIRTLAAEPSTALTQIGFDDRAREECTGGPWAYSDVEALARLALRELVVQSVKLHTREVQRSRRSDRGVMV